MARKELVIAIKAVDQISGPIRSTMTAIGRLGRRAIDTTARMLRSMGGLARSLLNIRTLFAGLAAAFAAGALIRTITSVAAALDQTAKAARGLGIEVEEYSNLEFAAQRSGIAVNQLGRAFLTAQRNAAQYVRGEGGAAVRAFRDLGANLTDANGRIKQGTELLQAILDPINKIQDEAVKSQKLFDIFGRQGAQLKNVGEQLQALLADAERYGSITRNQTEVAEQFRDSLTNLGRAWTFLRASVLEAIGPPLTRAINTAAAKMADLGRLVGGILKAIVETADDPDTRLALGNALSSLLFSANDVLIVGVQALFRSAGVVIENSIPPLLILIRNTLGPSIGNVIIETVGGALARFYDWMGDSASGPARNAFSRYFQDLAQQTRDGVSYLKEEMGHGGELRQAFDDSLVASFRSTSSKALRDISSILNESFERIHTITARDGGDLAGIIDSLLARVQRVKADLQSVPPGPSAFASFSEGVRAAADDVGEMAAQWRRLGTDVFNTAGNQISRGLGDLATGAARTKDAFRDMARGILDDLTRLIIRMAVFNALSAAFGGGSIRAASLNNTPAGGFPSAGNGFREAFARTGGVIQPGGHVRRFAGGGVVPGPNINRDMVPALLAPGEGVVNRRGMRNLGSGGLASINRGEGEMGGGVVVNMVNHFNGGFTPSMANQAAGMLEAAILKSLNNKPGFRDQMKARLT